MITPCFTFAYAFYENEPCLIIAFRDEHGCGPQAVITMNTSGEIKVVNLVDVKLNIDKLVNLKR